MFDSRQRSENRPILLIIRSLWLSDVWSTDVLELADSADGDPFGHVEISLMVEAGIVRVNKLACDPPLWLTTHGKVVCEDLFQP